MDISPDIFRYETGEILTTFGQFERAEVNMYVSPKVFVCEPKGKVPDVASGDLNLELHELRSCRVNCIVGARQRGVDNIRNQWGWLKARVK